MGKCSVHELLSFSTLCNLGKGLGGSWGQYGFLKDPPEAFPLTLLTYSQRPLVLSAL